MSVARIWDVWTNTAEEEMLILLQEFIQDFSYDKNFLWAIRRIERFLLDGQFDEAEELFEEYYPSTLGFVEYSLFRQLLEEMEDEQYYIY
jgi:hypothetical protein